MLTCSWTSLTVLNMDGLIVGICILSGNDEVAESNGLTLGLGRKRVCWDDVGVVNTLGDEAADAAADLLSRPLPFPPLPLSIIILAAIEPEPEAVCLPPLSAPPPDDEGVLIVVSRLLDDGVGFSIVEQRTNEAPTAFGVRKKSDEVPIGGVHDIGLGGLWDIFSPGDKLQHAFPWVFGGVPSRLGPAVASGAAIDSSWSISSVPWLIKMSLLRLKVHKVPPETAVPLPESQIYVPPPCTNNGSTSKVLALTFFSSVHCNFLNFR